MKWTPETLRQVWERGRVLPEADPSLWRQDACGAWMRRDQFGRERSEFGWKIERVSAGGADTPENLRPFHWRNRPDLANGRPHCTVTADRSGVGPGEFASPPLNREI